MRRCTRPPSGFCHPLFVLALLLGTMGLGSIAAAIVEVERPPWSASQLAILARRADDRPTTTRPMRFTGSPVNSQACQPRPAVCAPAGATAVDDPGAETSKPQSRPGEREIFLHASAAAARGQVWVQEYVATPPAADFDMIASTSPYP